MSIYNPKNLFPNWQKDPGVELFIPDEEQRRELIKFLKSNDDQYDVLDLSEFYIDQDIIDALVEGFKYNYTIRSINFVTHDREVIQLIVRFPDQLQSFNFTLLNIAIKDEGLLEHYILERNKLINGLYHLFLQLSGVEDEESCCDRYAQSREFATKLTKFLEQDKSPEERLQAFGVLAILFANHCGSALSRGDDICGPLVENAIKQFIQRGLRLSKERLMQITTQGSLSDKDDLTAYQEPLTLCQLARARIISLQKAYVSHCIGGLSALQALCGKIQIYLNEPRLCTTSPRCYQAITAILELIDMRRITIDRNGFQEVDYINRLGNLTRLINELRTKVESYLKSILVRENASESDQSSDVTVVSKSEIDINAEQFVGGILIILDGVNTHHMKNRTSLDPSKLVRLCQRELFEEKYFIDMDRQRELKQAYNNFCQEQPGVMGVLEQCFQPLELTGHAKAQQFVNKNRNML